MAETPVEPGIAVIAAAVGVAGAASVVGKLETPENAAGNEYAAEDTGGVEGMDGGR